MNAPKTMLLEDVLRRYRVGSYDWTWEQEFIDVRTRFAESFAMLCTDIQENGIREPILLGDDGRVWDGHKRLTVASVLALESVPVEFSNDLRRQRSKVHIPDGARASLRAAKRRALDEL